MVHSEGLQIDRWRGNTNRDSIIRALWWDTPPRQKLFSAHEPSMLEQNRGKTVCLTEKRSTYWATAFFMASLAMSNISSIFSCNRKRTINHCCKRAVRARFCYFSSLYLPEELFCKLQNIFNCLKILGNFVMQKRQVFAGILTCVSWHQICKLFGREVSFCIERHHSAEGKF